MSKVRCKTCEHEANGYCIKKKNIKIKLNKRRLCKNYKDDESKYVAKSVIKSTYIPYEDRKKIPTTRSAPINMNAVANNKHPLTGDLSKRFRTTAGDK